jgi:hypothetical protein
MTVIGSPIPFDNSRAVEMRGERGEEKGWERREAYPLRGVPTGERGQAEVGQTGMF